jgi:hypothetical protein
MHGRSLQSAALVEVKQQQMTYLSHGDSISSGCLVAPSLRRTFLRI